MLIYGLASLFQHLCNHFFPLKSLYLNIQRGLYYYGWKFTDITIKNNDDDVDEVFGRLNRDLFISMYYFLQFIG